MTGYNGNEERPLGLKRQVQALIAEATDPENLSQGYVAGWLPYW